MGVRRAVSLILAALIVLNLPIILFLGVSTSIVFDKPFYLSEFRKNGVYDGIGDKELPSTLATQLISYFGDKTVSPPQVDLFTEDENKHLLDVKLLVNGLKKAVYISSVIALLSLLILLIFYRAFIFRRFGKLLLFGGILTLALGAAIFIFSHNFEMAFTNFHTIFFPQGNWTFPEGSFLLFLFPKKLFYEFFMVILLRTFVLSVLLAAAGLIIMRRRKEYKTPAQ